MPKDHDKQRLLTRRAVIFGGVQTVVFGALAARLAYLQFFRADEYETLSEQNHIKLQPVAAERGRILDRFGAPLADNKKNYQLFIDSSSLTKKAYQEAVETLAKMLDLPEERIKELGQVRPSAATPPQLVKEHLSWEEVSQVELRAYAMPGVRIEAGQLRHYPLSENAAHLTGYIGAASEKELENDRERALLRLPEFKIGKIGVEKMLEPRLRGVAAVRKLEVNVHGMVVREVGKTEGRPGEDVRLTVDRDLQDAIAGKLEGQSGSGVVLEIATGNVLALVSVPAYDPNSFSRGIRSKEWARLNADKKIPLLNKSIGGQYPPGSTFKMMVGLAGLESKQVRPDFTVFCPGYFMLGRYRFGCWKPGGHGHVDYHAAVQQSCDTFFYTVAQRIGIQPFADMARRFGLDRRYDLGIIGEKKGIIPDPEWKHEAYRQKWTGGDTINASIGQGYVLATPLQLAVMAARLASGKAVTPRLLPGQKPDFAPLDVTERFMEMTREGMAAAVNEPGGTAYGSRIADPDMAFAGKTGTSQVRRLIRLGMNQASLPWQYRHHALFIGYAPLDHPKYAVAIVVEHGGGGSSAAAPVAKEALLKAQTLDRKKAEGAPEA